MKNRNFKNIFLGAAFFMFLTGSIMMPACASVSGGENEDFSEEGAIAIPSIGGELEYRDFNWNDFQEICPTEILSAINNLNSVDSLKYFEDNNIQLTLNDEIYIVTELVKPGSGLGRAHVVLCNVGDLLGESSEED